MKYSHKRCPSNCQHGHLTNSSQTHPTKQTEQARPLIRSLSFIVSQKMSYCWWLKSSANKTSVDILRSGNVRTFGDARCVQTAPTDRQTHPTAFPASPLLHPSTSVTLTVKAHLSICGSNCSLGWLSFQRLPVTARTRGEREAPAALEHTPIC